MHTITCKNCEQQYTGNYCPHCGQSSHVERINAAYFLHDVPHSVLHIDKGFFYTLGKLLKNPGIALKLYLEGKRVKHFRPFAFVVLMSTICTLLIKGLNYLVTLKYKKANPGGAIDFGNSLFEKYPSLLIFIMIPLLSLVTWIFFRKRGFNYWEHFLVNTYLAAYLNVFFLIISLFQTVKYYITGGYVVNYAFFMFFFMAYYGHAFGGLMSSTGTLKQNILLILFMNFFLASIYMTVFSLTGIMTPWWGK